MQLRRPYDPRRGGWLGAVAATLLAAIVWLSPARAQRFSSYSDFQAMSQADLARLQVKLTYAGNQTVGTRSLLFTAAGNNSDIALFTPFRRPDISYVNDDSPPLTFTATTQQLKAVIDSVGTLPDVTDGQVAPDGYVSFALLSTAGGVTKVFETVVNDTTGPELFARLLAALKSNRTGLHQVSEFGCGADVLPRDAPSSVQGQVSISFTGLRRDRRSKNVFVRRVSVRNISTSSIAAPLSLVVVRQGNAELLGETGLTCNIHPPGFPYIDLPVGGSLSPGATVEVVLRFANPSLEAFDVGFRAFAGPGTR